MNAAQKYAEVVALARSLKPEVISIGNGIFFRVSEDGNLVIYGSELKSASVELTLEGTQRALKWITDTFRDENGSGG